MATKKRVSPPPTVESDPTPQPAAAPPQTARRRKPAPKARANEAVAPQSEPRPRPRPRREPEPTPKPPKPARKAASRAAPPASRGLPGELPPVESYRCADVTPQTRVSRYFTVRELTVSDLAQRRGIDNRFDSDAHLQAAVHLARCVLDPLREHHGGPFSPNSVFRSQALERELKGRPGSWISTSQHTEGCACDVELPGVSTLELARWAAANLQPFDQIICECYDAAEGVNSGWVHISRLAPGQGTNRGEQLSYVRDPKSGQWVYVKGFRGA